MTQQEQEVEASLRATWVLGKHKEPLSDTELIKKYMSDVMEAMLEGE